MRRNALGTCSVSRYPRACVIIGASSRPEKQERTVLVSYIFKHHVDFQWKEQIGTNQKKPEQIETIGTKCKSELRVWTYDKLWVGGDVEGRGAVRKEELSMSGGGVSSLHGHSTSPLLRPNSLRENRMLGNQRHGKNYDNNATKHSASVLPMESSAHPEGLRHTQK